MGTRLTVHNSAVVKGTNGGPDHAYAPEVLAFLRRFELVDFVFQVIEEANVVRIPVLLAKAAVGRVEGRAQIHVVGAVVQKLLAHVPDELAEYGLVVDEGAEDGKARHELSPYLVRTLVMLEVLLWRDGCTHAHPLDESLAATIREAGCRYADGDLGFRSIVITPDGNVTLRVGFGEGKGEVRLQPRVFVREGRSAPQANTFGDEGLVEHPVEIDHGLEVAVQQGAFGHLLHNLPQLALFHAVLCKTEHHAGKDVDMAASETVFVLLGPQGLLLLKADLGDDGAGFLGGGREVLSEVVVCRLSDLFMTALVAWTDRCAASSPGAPGHHGLEDISG